MREFGFSRHYLLRNRNQPPIRTIPHAATVIKGPGPIDEDTESADGNKILLKTVPIESGTTETPGVPAGVAPAGNAAAAATVPLDNPLETIMYGPTNQPPEKWP
jgi:hypothetical protein